jgi:hypothetical protein
LRTFRTRIERSRAGSVVVARGGTNGTWLMTQLKHAGLEHRVPRPDPVQAAQTI